MSTLLAPKVKTSGTVDFPLLTTLVKNVLTDRPLTVLEIADMVSPDYQHSHLAAAVHVVLYRLFGRGKAKVQNGNWTQ